MGRTMLRVSFVVGFDAEGRITGVSRNCPIPRITCEGCRFKEWCDRVERLILRGG